MKTLIFYQIFFSIKLKKRCLPTRSMTEINSLRWAPSKLKKSKYFYFTKPTKYLGFKVKKVAVRPIFSTTLPPINTPKPINL